MFISNFKTSANWLAILIFQILAEPKHLELIDKGLSFTQIQIGDKSKLLTPSEINYIAFRKIFRFTVCRIVM